MKKSNQKIYSREITEKRVWDTFLQTHTEANFLQSWEWGAFYEVLNHRIFRIGFYEQDTLQGIMLAIVENAKRATYLTVPAGPILDFKNRKIITLFKKTITEIAQKTNCSFVRVRPQLVADSFSKNIFTKMGFKNSPMHLHAQLTNQLDITKPEQELLSNMRKATRYEIRKAEKIGIEIKKSQNPKDIKKFYNLQLKTARRQGFVPFSYDYLHEQFRVFANNDKAILYSSYFEKKLLSQAFIIFYKDEAVYHYGASTEQGRSYPGAYLIQWTAIQEAQKRGMKRYNFWGVARDRGHRFSNLSLFKRGFGGSDVEYLHAQDLVIQKIPYFINYVIEQTRKRIRHV